MSHSHSRRTHRRFVRRFVATTFALLPAIAVAGPAAAESICVEDANGFAWVFPQAKLPNKAGKVTELHGYTRSGAGQIGTVTGTAVRMTSGEYAIGVTALRWGIDSAAGAAYLGYLDADLTGILVRENTFPPQTLTLDPLDCVAVPTP
jgi:hypothetical protein